MSINYCTLNSSAVDGFCGTARAKVLALLLAVKYPVVPPVEVPHGPSHAVPGMVHHDQNRNNRLNQQAKQNQRPRDQWVPPVISTELDRIIVRAHVPQYDFRGQAEQAVRPDNNIVVVTNIRVEGTTLGVNISNLRFNQATDAAS